jgi:glycosidase
MEFHISRQARDRYQFDQSLFSFSGNVIFANFHAVRVFVQKMNQKRDLLNFPERALRAGEVNALGLVDEILHYVLNLYRQQRNPQVMQQALDFLTEQLGKEALQRTLRTFTLDFPPVAVYRKEMTVDEYLSGSTDGIPNQTVALEELLMLWVANENPATSPYLELFDDNRLETSSNYRKVIQELHSFFDTQPPFGPDHQNLVDMLRAPAIAVPNSLAGQLEFIRERWSELLGRFLYRLLSSLDLIREEQKLSFMGPGPVPIPVYGMGLGEAEPERFSQDKEWMPRLVLMAKNTYVWLDQLSKKYSRSIVRLDQVPDEELDLLAQWGFSGLWLIGLWERSTASARIKQFMGNNDAVASAYSLKDYGIAWDLGGDEAYQNLRDRAWKRGIRLASDMVPNHMGIDSPWMMDHSDWFIGLDYSPFPSYSFNGPDLSNDGRVGIFLEDHYYDRTDAAVVFKRRDRESGQERYIYHGNDGTSMPWNDTAQLNYLNPQVREAIIQTILQVARKFPIIRFDAAMTLAKKHFQRLWFPEPGTGGAIPSRAEYGMTKEQFDAIMPIEFWREVVDRAAVEAPDTLLLAEAFWLMEGYFVRTLGMHRVYNSAFMNLLRNEENDKYRTVMKNTLEFDPEILKRFVNFMNNPDERTAVDQFGKGDKYFGVCTLMATMPGLPMFGHGQVQGFSEKYGMEFRKPLWDEQIDPYLVERHEREIFPLLHRRGDFAGVENFLLYDFFTPEGGVDENVFAYSNGLGSERNLVVYHNKYAGTRGWIRSSVGYMDKAAHEVRQHALGEGLNLHPGENTFLIYRDHASGLQYLSPSAEVIEKGLYLDLGAYKYHVFLDFHEVEDDAWHSYRQLNDFLGGRGVPNIQDAMRELLLQPVQQPFREIANPGYFRYLLDHRLSDALTKLPPELLAEAQQKFSHLLDGVIFLTGETHQVEEVRNAILHDLEAVLSLSLMNSRYPLPGSRTYPAAVQWMLDGLGMEDNHWLALFGFVFTHRLGLLTGTSDFENQTLSWFDEWQFGKLLDEAVQNTSATPDAAWKIGNEIRLLIGQQRWFNQLGTKPLDQVLTGWLAEEEVQRFLRINRYKDILWFNHEAFQDFLWCMMLAAVLEGMTDSTLSASDVVERVLSVYDIILKLQQAEKGSGYQLEKLLQAIEE